MRRTSALHQRYGSAGLVPALPEADRVGAQDPGRCISASRRVDPNLLRRVCGALVLATGFLLGPAVTRSSAQLVESCEDVCGTGTGACTIGQVWFVEPDSILDCSGRDLSIAVGGWLKVTDGSLTLKARDLTTSGTAAGAGGVMAVEGPDEMVGDIEIELTGNASLRGAIRANGDHGAGTVSIVAAGNITIPEGGTDGIECDGTGIGADGGEIVLEAGGSITIHDPIHAAGANSADSSGGTIEIRAQGDILIQADGHVSAEGFAGGGGQITINSAGGDVIVQEHLDVEGRSSTGSGGTIEISAGDRVELGEQITVRGGVHANGGQADGGSLQVHAGCGGITVAASILATGGQVGSRSGSGSVHLETTGSIVVNSGVLIDAHALSSNGFGGQISADAGQVVSVQTTALLDARGGTSAPGSGGAVRLRGCSVDIYAGATLDVRGDLGGTVYLAARDVGPGEGTQPLRVHTGALLKAKGTAATGDGAIRLGPLHAKRGKCLNNEAIACQLDSECTVGCETSDCRFANPDSDGVNTQFDIVPVRFADAALTQCAAVCVP